MASETGMREYGMSEYGEYLRVAAAWKSEFSRNQERYGERIHCRRGCSDCCSQMFQITEIEAAFISGAVKAMPEKEKVEMRERAQTYQERRLELLASRDAPDAWGALPPPGLRLPCPALVEGACSIYEHRPMICRKYGIPLYNPRKPENIFACELNFKPGEEITDPELVGIHTQLHNRWAVVQADYNHRGGRRDPHPITVARAILEDFEPYLPRASGENK